MNLVLAYLGLALFLALPPFVLFARSRFGESFPWWAVVLIVAGGGWLFVNVWNYFYGAYNCELVFGVENPPEDALARCTNDGARNTFALLFGWLYALIYSIPFFLLFAVVAWIRRRKLRPRAHAV